MTVAELKNLLSTFDDNATVCIRSGQAAFGDDMIDPEVYLDWIPSTEFTSAINNMPLTQSVFVLVSNNNACQPK